MNSMAFSIRFACCLFALLFVASACAPTFVNKGPLTYDEVPYTSVQGEPWEVKSVALPELGALHGVATTPRVAYVELNPEGEQTIIFVHGLGSYLKFWRYQLDYFASKGYRVLAIDMIGYGRSDKPATFPYTMEAMGDVLKLFIEKTDSYKPIVVGHSMGGQTALSFAIRYPDIARGLVLTAPAGFEKFSEKEKLWFESVFTVNFIKSATEEEIWGSVRRNNFYRWEKEYTWLVEERVRLALSDEFDAYAYANVRSVQGLTRNDFVRENARRIQIPVLIVHGDMDRLIPNPFLHGGNTIKVMKYGASEIPDARLETLRRCGHTIQMDCHGEYNSLVEGYLSEVFPTPPERPAAPAVVEPELPETPSVPEVQPKDKPEAIEQVPVDARPEGEGEEEEGEGGDAEVVPEDTATPDAPEDNTKAREDGEAVGPGSESVSE